VIDRATLVQSARPGTPSPQRAIWRLLPLAEQAAVFYLLAIAAGVHGFVDVMFYAKSSDVVTEGESLLSSLVWPLAYVLFAALIVLRSQTVHRAFLSAPWVALYAGCAALSVIWSVDPLITANGAVRLAMTTLIGLYIGSHFTPTEVLRLLFWVLFPGVLASILVDLAGLDFARMLNGATRGVFYHKNVLGSRAVLLLAVCLSFLVSGTRPLHAILGLVVALAALVMAQSGTSFAAAAAVVAATFCLVLRGDWLRVAFRCALGVALAVLLASVLTWWQVNPILAALDLLGKDMSLTGRTMLWQAALTQFWERPLLGIGFDGFWHAAIDTRTFLVLNVMGHAINHFHNTYLDVAVQLGVLGLFAAGATLTCWFWTAVVYLVRTPGQGGVGPILFITAGLVASLTELNLFVKHELSTIMLVALAVGMSRQPSAR
jgi:exopolysaccharide production protein ExoQ